jgi:hypothetical protein
MTFAQRRISQNVSPSLDDAWLYSFTKLVAGRTIQAGGPRVGDLWYISASTNTESPRAVPCFSYLPQQLWNKHRDPPRLTLTCATTTPNPSCRRLFYTPTASHEIDDELLSYIYNAHRNPQVLINSFNYLLPFGLRDNATLPRTKHSLRQFLLKTTRTWALNFCSTIFCQRQ